MKIKRYGRRSDTGPALIVERPGGETFKAKHSNLGATINKVTHEAERHYEAATWLISEEEDGTLRATVQRTVDRRVETRVVGIHAIPAQAGPTPE